MGWDSQLAFIDKVKHLKKINSWSVVLLPSSQYLLSNTATTV